MPQFSQMPQTLFPNQIYIRPSVAQSSGTGQSPQEGGMFLQSPPAQQPVQQQQVSRVRCKPRHRPT